jgi:two-component system NtrC family sensor kinase
MTALPQDVAGDLRRRIAELEQELHARAAENARLQAELHTARDRQDAGAEILRTIANAPADAGRSLQQIAETSARLFGAPSVSIQLIEDGKWGESYRFGDSAQRIRATVPLTQIRVEGRNLPGTVFREDRQIHIPDIDHPDPSMADSPGLPAARASGTRTMCGSPLRREGKAIGVLVVYRDQLAPFTEEELALQQSFADQAAIAIENARLFNETREALERQTATADILKVIASSPSDVQPVFDVIVERAVRLCGGHMGRVYRYDGDLIQMVAGHALSAPGLDRVQQVFPRPAADDTTAGLAIRSRRPYFVTDIKSDQSVPPLSRQMIEALGTRSQVTVPMLRAGEPIGAITVGWADPGAYGDQQLTLLQTFADQAVIAIENVRLFNETRAALERQTATADILKVIASSPSDVQPVFEAIAVSANRLIGGFSSTVFRIIDGIAYLKAFTPTTPAADEVLIATFPRPVADFPPFRMAQAGEVTQVPDTEALSDDILNIARARGFRSMLFAPLMNDGMSIGLIAVTRLEPGSFADHHVQLLRTFADQAVIAIENVRLFNEVQERTRELSASLDELRAAQDRLVQTEKLASLGQLTAGIAHEIKNPLNFVNNFAALSAELTDELNEVLAPAALDEKTREEIDEITHTLKGNLERVVQHGKRADSIVKNMLLHSREGSGEHRPADINAIVEESLNLAYHGARAETSVFNITLKRDLDPNAGMVDLYPQEITRVLLNLISNGFYAATKRKETGEAGFEPTLSATTKSLGNKVEIRIRDNGTGIPPEVKEKMFNPFFTTKPAGEGTGLGLSMSHDIVVKQHGGRIDVETEPSSFTEFIIVLPRTLAARATAGGTT